MGILMNLHFSFKGTPLLYQGSFTSDDESWVTIYNTVGVSTMFSIYRVQHSYRKADMTAV